MPAFDPITARSQAVPDLHYLDGGPPYRAGLDRLQLPYVSGWALDLREPGREVHVAIQVDGLTLEDAPPPNGARHLFLTDGCRSAHLGLYERGFDLFDGGDAAALAAARERWKEAKAAGHGLAYWQQTASGWERRA